MKKALLVGAATLAVSVIVGTGLGSVSASSKDVRGESTPATKTTASAKATAEEIVEFEKNATAEEIASFEAESTPAVKTTQAKKATAEEIAEFEKNATAEEIVVFEKVSKEGTEATKK